MGVVLLGAFLWMVPARIVVLEPVAPPDEVTLAPAADEGPDADVGSEVTVEPEAPALADVEAESVPTPAVEEGVPAGETSKTTPRSGCVPKSRGIDQIGPKKWRVKRSLIEKYTSNSSAASTLARVKWAKTRSGKTRGLRLTRVPCKSPLRAAGLQSKDLILEVDGKSVTSYAQGLRIWAAIRRKSSFTVKVRRGKAVRIHRYILG